MDPTDKTNYRSVSVLPLLSKVFEKVVYEQLYVCLNNYLNDLPCSFRKAYLIQHALIKSNQSWKNELDISAFVGTLLTELSYDCLPRDILIAKLEAYGLDKPSVSLVNDYLSFQKQSTKIGTSYSNWANVIRGIPRDLF